MGHLQGHSGPFGAQLQMQMQAHIQGLMQGLQAANPQDAHHLAQPYPASTLDEWGGDRCKPIFESLQGSMMQLSIQKFSSNVVEKLFCAAPPDFRALFISELIESDQMAVLVNSNYGHYV